MASLDDLTTVTPPTDPSLEQHALALEDEARDTPRDPKLRGKRKEFVASVIKECLERHSYICTRESAQRAREDDDLRFDRSLLEDVWPENIRKGRAGRVVGGEVLDARPMLVIPKLDQPVQQVIQEGRRARLAINVKPRGAKASKKGAFLRQGMIRAIEADCGAQNARMWAFDRCVKVGRGYYRLVIQYANDNDDQLDIAVKRIKHQGSVFLDPDFIEPDWSDGRYAIITVDLSHEEYRERYGKSPVLDSPFPLEGVSEQYQNQWCNDRTIRVAEYWVMEKKMLPGSTRKRPVVKRYVLSSNDILEEQAWPGRWIPMCLVVGKEYNIGGEVTYKGLISNGKDAARGYNYMRSATVEMVGAAPKAPYLADIRQIKGHEDAWDNLNTRNSPYLPYNRFDPTGKVDYGVPQRNFGEPAIQAVSMEVASFDRDIMAVTGRYEPSRGQLSTERSGKAIQALQQQAETSSSGYLENLASYTLPHEGRMMLDLLPHVYQEPGRIIRLLGDTPKDESYAMLGTPFVPDGPDGLPVAYEPPNPKRTFLAKLGLGPPPPPPPENLTEYRLDDGGDYMVTVTVGRSFATERDANKDVLEAIMKAAPQLVPHIVDLWVENLDSTMSDQVVERLRRMNPALAGGEAQIPPEVQAQMQQAQQQIAQLQGDLQQAQQEISTNASKTQAEVAIKQMEIDSRERIAALENETTLRVKAADLNAKASLTLLEARIAELERDSEQEYEATKMAVGMVSDRRNTREEREHAKRTAAEQRAFEKDQTERAAALEQQAEARADRKSVV